MDRRNFLKQSCVACIAIGAGVTIGSLSSCATLPVYQTAVDANKIIVPVSLFAQTDFRIVQPQNFFYNIGLQKEKDGTYTALLLRCTHADNQLTPTGNGYKCNLHGSTFDKEGQVTQGPAERALKKFQTELNSGNIIIHLS
jgi:nitrite reductase/ring-hydroxylating ferredoxin subunit